LLAEFKLEKRKTAVEELNNLEGKSENQIWGNINGLRADNSPWFMMAGRDDSRQKGFDVFSSAIDGFLSEGGEAQFLLFPIPGEEGLNGLSYLENLAEKYPHNVIVLPFIFRTGYLSTIQGANFGVMPSFYEPFGMANEFYLNGTLGIGRATGGILHQIIPYREGRSFSGAVRVRTERWFKGSAQPTGFLYRESDGIPTELHDWEEINRADFNQEIGIRDRLAHRQKLPLFQDMVSQLTLALLDAVNLYKRNPDQYFEMVIDGYQHIRRYFSWKKTAKSYLRYLQVD
jgi:glycogen synthase